jgi:hypothetical protein
MFVRIIAEAVADDVKAGKSHVTPYWRLVRDDGRLLKNLPAVPQRKPSIWRPTDTRSTIQLNYA